MSYKWQDALHKVVIRLADGVFIPEDTRNRDWRAFQEWVALGNTPTAPDTITPPTPQELVDLIAAAKNAENPAATALLLLCKGLAAGAIIPGATTLAQMKIYMVNNWPT